MGIKEMIRDARPGTGWLTEGFTEIEVKQNRDLGDISAEIEMRRHEMGLNQKQMAELLGVSQGMVSRYESGEYNFTIGSLNEICDKIGLKFEPVLYDPQKARDNIRIIKKEPHISGGPHIFDPFKLEAIA